MNPLTEAHLDPGTEIVAWTQWPDLTVPDNVTLLSDPSGLPDPSDYARITFYVPTYMGAAAALEPIRQMPKLQVLQVPNAGYNDAAAYLDRAIVLCNARGVHDDSTAELAIGLALAVRRGFADFAAQQADRQWLHRRYRSFVDSRVAIVGYGSVGRRLHEMLRGFGTEVVGFSRTAHADSRGIAELAELISSFDIVFLTLPLHASTVRLCDANLLSRMRTGAVLVNVGRGAVVDTDALVAELRAGRISAGLDVTDPEPLPPEHPLWTAPNCIITPHVGGDTTAFESRGRRLIERQLGAYAAGEPLENVVLIGPVDPATLPAGH